MHHPNEANYDSFFTTHFASLSAFVPLTLFVHTGSVRDQGTAKWALTLRTGHSVWSLSSELSKFGMARSVTEEGTAKWALSVESQF